MAIRESTEEALARWEQLEILQKEYTDFNTFMVDVIEDLMGFNCSDLQLDIGDYLLNGPKYSMIQAQRGQAKTTITAIYAVWCLIHDPSFRILIVSSGGPMAKEIAGWIIQIINGMDVLECMRPDRAAGDRSSIESFDIHYSLKGPEKSPSVACMGITANIQGRRADLLIADDIESSKNASTDTQRAQLLHLTLDFTSICSKGKVVYLGTPQSIDSIYNTLPGRGYHIRIWPGRYPTEEEEKNYGHNLAPFIVRKMAADPSLRNGGGPAGERGQPTDPVILPEDVLTAKEIDQGAAYFQLQHMLDTRLSDAERYPLKLNKLIFANIPDERTPVQFDYIADSHYQIYPPTGMNLNNPMYRSAGFTGEFVEFSGTHMYVDPAGGGANGDETAYAITRFVAGRIFLVDVGGVPGGIDDASLDRLCDKVEQWAPSVVHVEENFGKGMFAQVWRPKLFARDLRVSVEDVWESGQKELRIIDTLEPVMGRRKLVVDERLIEDDWNQCQKYGTAKAQTYSFFFQLDRITRDKRCLQHDDRLDAVAGTVRYWKDVMAQDEDKAVAQARQKARDKFMSDPFGNGRKLQNWGGNTHKSPNAFNRFKRKF